MSWLTPLGFLGLLGILVLIIIYILKPNYQQKFISSTFIWKLSLKYKKKRIPISKLRNILLIICQMLIITACAFIFAQPVIKSNAEPEVPEKIVVIDASAGMMTIDDETGTTRFQRAVSQVKTLAEDLLEQQGILTVIVADDEASYLVQRSNADTSEDIYTKLNELKTSNYGSADIDGAMLLAEKVLEENPKSEILLYTGTEYIEKGEVTVVNVAKESEWNAAILDCEVTINENLFVFSVDVACYNFPDRLKLNCIISGVNGKNESYEVYQYVSPTENETETLRFDAKFYKDFVDSDSANKAWVYSFKEVYMYLETTTPDSFPYDDDFYLYGGEKERIDVQYYSTLANPFFDGALGSVGEAMRTRWDIYVDTPKETLPAFEGFDFYLFEHVVPEEMPKDGIVFLANPTVAPRGLDVQFGSTKDFGQEVALSNGIEHPITQYVNAENINVRTYTTIEWYGEGFEPLMYCDGAPILLVKNTPTEKVIVFTGNLHMSDLAVRYEFPILMYNIFNYFFPSTLTDFVYEVGETVTMNARGKELDVLDPLSNETTYGELPVDVVLSTEVKGVYGVSQTLISGELVEEYFFAKVPAVESNICRVVDELPEVSSMKEEEEEFDIKELLIYFLAGLVLLMFIEWWLQGQENA